MTDQELSRWIADHWPGGALTTHYDMVNDPAMTRMLLENMPDPMLWKETSTLWGCESFDGPDGHPVAFNTKLGRAVAEAFALANGWDPAKQPLATQSDNVTPPGAQTEERNPSHDTSGETDSTSR